MKASERKARAARYAKLVQWSAEDRCYVGTCPGLMYGGIHGPNEARVYAELCEAAEEVVELLEQENHPLPEPTAGRRYTGRVVLRLEPALHQALDLQARATGEKLSSFCAKKLATA